MIKNQSSLSLLFFFYIFLLVQSKPSKNKDIQIYLVKENAEHGQNNNNNDIKIKPNNFFNLEQQVPVYTYGQIQTGFNYTPKGEVMCNPNPSIKEGVENSERIFYIKNQSIDQTYQIEFLIKNLSYNNSVPKLVESTQYHQLFPGDIQQIQINYNCLTQDQDMYTWDRIYFEFSIFIQKQNQQMSLIDKQSFSILKICSQKHDRFDYSILVLFIISCLVISQGTKIREKFPLKLKLKNSDEEEEVRQELTTYHAIGFILIGSGFLIILYFFVDYLKYILLLSICFSSFSAGEMILSDFFGQIFKNSQTCGQVYFQIKGEKITLLKLISFIISGIIVVGYLFTKNFILSNIIALFFVLVMFKVIVMPNYKVAAIFLSLAFFYDIFWVFISPYFFGGNSVMVTVASNIHLPMTFQCPYFSDFYEPKCSLIGLGDLALPGAFVSFCYSVQKSFKTSSYHKVCVAGYCLSLFFCMYILIVYNMAQPALLYLAPGTLIPVMILAIKRGEFKQIWEGKVNRKRSGDGTLRNFQSDNKIEYVSENQRYKQKQFEKIDEEENEDEEEESKIQSIEMQ